MSCYTNDSLQLYSLSLKYLYEHFDLFNKVYVTNKMYNICTKMKYIEIEALMMWF